MQANPRSSAITRAAVREGPSERGCDLLHRSGISVSYKRSSGRAAPRAPALQWHCNAARKNRAKLHKLIASPCMREPEGIMYSPLPDDALPSRISTGHLPDPEEVEELVRQAYARYKDLDEGKVADYIPALAKVP